MVSSHEGPNPIVRALLSGLNYLPKDLPPNTITLGGKVSARELGEDTNISSITLAITFFLLDFLNWLAVCIEKAKISPAKFI